VPVRRRTSVGKESGVGEGTGGCACEVSGCSRSGAGEGTGVSKGTGVGKGGEVG
jgi:hypothetical protein